MLIKLELSDDIHHELIRYCKQKGIKILSAGFDLESLEFLKGLGVILAKIPSGEITNYLYLKKIAQLFETVILSTGMVDMQEIKDEVCFEGCELLDELHHIMA